MTREAVLKALEDELAFLEQRGYDRRADGNWRPPLIFEDSPICVRQPVGALGCETCALYEFVPRSAQHVRVPCRYIALDGGSRTLERLYCEATQSETVASVRAWLESTIAALRA